MPYAWTTPPTENAERAAMRLWPHRSLPPEGFGAVILGAFTLILIPVLSVLGTPILWGLLPFVLGAIWALWAALRRSYRDGMTCEELTLGPRSLDLIRTDPRRPPREWHANPYWVSVHLHREDGPVENYVTLKGAGREVEIGAFLSPGERLTLHADLDRLLASAQNSGNRSAPSPSGDAHV